MSNQFSLDNKIAAVTGASGLLGRQHCKALAEAGANIIAIDLNREACEGALQGLPGDNLALEMDVTSEKSIKDGLQGILDKYDRLDVLVNNAAINDMFEDPALAAETSRFENYPLKMWQKSLDVNVTGVFLCCQIMGNQMAQQESGSIINVASTYGIVAPNQDLYIDPQGKQTFYKSAAYPATKAAVLGLTRFLSAYWGHKNVRVNALSPGGVENGQDEWFVENYAKQTPIKRMARPDDYKGAVVFLASEASAYMTGANLVVDGGWTIW